MDPYFLKRLWRRPWLSVCSLTLSGVLCFLMCFLAGYRQEQARQLEQAQDSFEVLCVVSNLRGNQTSSLRLWSWAESFVTSDEYPLHSYVKDLRMTKEFEVSCPELMLSDAMAVGVTNARCVPRLDPALGGGTKEIGDDFYTSRERICLVSEAVYAELGEEKTVELSLRDPSVNEFLEPELGFGTYTFQIVGCYNGLGVDVYLPFGTARDIALEISGRTTVDSIAFLAADNRKLAELSEAASGKFKAVDPLAADSLNTSAALTIHDEQYRATVAALEQNLERSACLLPMLLLLSLAMGFLISLLSTRGESRTYALMRTLGMTRGKLFASILREQLFLAGLAACVAGCCTGRAWPAGWYLLCHGAGCCIAVIRCVRATPIAILREQE